MASWFNWIAGRRVAPVPVPTDTVVPVYWLDDTKTYRAIVMYCTLVYDDVLDADKLAGALEKLLEKPGWRKLGARLRLNANGKLEYHIPEKYTKERPGVTFTHVQHDMNIQDHPQGKLLPRANGFMQVGASSDRFRSLVTPKDVPTKLEDYCYSDRPQLGVHIVSFADATILTTTWMHTFLDAMSQAAIFNAWTAVLEGRDEDVPEFFGEKNDPLASLGARIDLDEEENEEFLLKSKTMTNANMVKFVFGMLWESTLCRAEETRSIIIPAKLFAAIKTQALNDLKDADPSTLVMDTRDPTNRKLFISDGDILCAWTEKLLTSCQPWVTSALPSRIIHIMNIFNMTDLLRSTEPKLLPKDGVHIGNCTVAVSSLFRMDDLLSQPVGVVAAKIRSDLVAQTTRPQINANLRLMKVAFATTGHPPLFGEGDMILAAFTNWAKGKIFDTDFKAAVVKEGTGKHVVGKPTGSSVSGSTVTVPVRNSGPCIGKDFEGNWWLGAALRPETWANVERKLDEINRGIAV